MLNRNGQNVCQIRVDHFHSVAKLVRPLYAHVCQITLDAHQIVVPNALQIRSVRQIEHASMNAVAIRVRAAVVFQLIVTY